jgi:MOSC domain-containing protein
MTVGRVAAIWRYPVKSMGGEELRSCLLAPRGIPGDRGWAVRDEAAAEIRGAKKLPKLLLCNARYAEEPSGDRIPAAEIALPDGNRVWSDGADTAARLSELLGRRVSVWPLRPADDRAHYRRGRPDDPDMERELRSMLGLEPDEPLPDLSIFPIELFEYTSIPGTYFDALPVHFLTTATLHALGHANGSSKFDVRRFRPNFLIEAEGHGFVENGWAGRRLRIGGATVAVAMATPRCVMTTLPQADLPKDPAVLRTIVRDAGQNVGVYANVAVSGPIAVGDRVELEEGPG